MPKGVKNGPQHQRLISRVEAAAMLGCSAQTISNWVKKGIIKGHKIDDMLLVDKESIEILFDTAADVAEMEKKLKDLKREFYDEIQKKNQELKDLYENNLTRIQKTFLSDLINGIVDTVKGQISKKELIIVTGILRGWPTSKIAKEIGCSHQAVTNTWSRLKPRIYEILDYPKVRKEKEELEEENRLLKDEIFQSNQDNTRTRKFRDLQLTPFAKDITEFGFSYRVTNSLSGLGIKTLADLLRYDTTTLMSFPKMGPATIAAITDKLGIMGLHLGKDPRFMNEQEFNVIVDNVNDYLSGKTAEDQAHRFEIWKENVAERFKKKNQSITLLKLKVETTKVRSKYLKSKIVEQEKEVKKLRKLDIKNQKKIKKLQVELRALKKKKKA